MRLTEQLLDQYLGRSEQARVGYAADAGLRAGAASGGVVTAILVHLLETKRIAGALVTRVVCENGVIRPVVEIATTRAALLAAQSSTYFNVPLLKEGLPLLRAFPGPAAVVGLPCDATAFRRLCAREPDLAAKIRFVISLFCNHSSSACLLEKVLEVNGVDRRRVRSFHFRRGHWRGRLGGTLDDGTEFALPYSRYSNLQNLHFFSLRRCLDCGDFAGADSDFSTGDAWDRKLKAHPIKHSSFFARRPEAEQVLREMVSAGRLEAREISRRELFAMHKRSFIYHANVTARARAAARYGLRLRDPAPMPVRWNDALSGRIILFNYMWSQDPLRREQILKLPRPVLRAYLVLLSLLQNF